MPGRPEPAPLPSMGLVPVVFAACHSQAPGGHGGAKYVRPDCAGTFAVLGL
jgi:hypothetical protein